jgi:hypothetical protein
MKNFKPRYEKGNKIRYKRNLIDNNSDIAEDILIIKDVCCEEKNNYFYYETELLSGQKLVTTHVDCKLLEDNTELI